MGNFMETATEKINEFAEDNPTGFVGACYAISMAVIVPFTIACYKYFGKCTGKSCAKELIKSGAVLMVPKS